MAKTLMDADKLVKLWIKRMLHLNVHTPDASLYAKIRENPLGILELRSCIPHIYLKRLEKMRENDGDLIGQRLSYTEDMDKWCETISSDSITRGLQNCVDSPASHSWINTKPLGWSGRNFVRGIQLRVGNLATAVIKSNPGNLQQCRSRCNKKETICYVL